MVLYHIVFWSHVISNNFVVALGYWICSFMSMIFHALDRNFAFDGTRSTVIVTLWQRLDWKIADLDLSSHLSHQAVSACLVSVASQLMSCNVWAAVILASGRGTDGGGVILDFACDAIPLPPKQLEHLVNAVLSNLLNVNLRLTNHGLLTIVVGRYPPNSWYLKWYPLIKQPCLSI